MSGSQQDERNRAVIEALGGGLGGERGAYPSPPQVPMEPLVPGPAGGVPWPREEGVGRLPLGFWVWVDAFLALGVAILLQLGLLLAYAAMAGGVGQDDIAGLESNPTFVLLASPTLGLGFMALALLRIMMLRRLPWRWFNLNRERLGMAVGLGVAAGIVCLVLNIIIGLIVQFYGSVPDQAEQIIGPFREAAPWQLGLLGLFIVIIGPFFEEVFFRGYALRAFLQRFGIIPALLLNGALFSVPHALSITEGFIGLLLPIFVVGIILGAVYIWTGNLWSAVVAHCVNNGVAFIGLLVGLYGAQ